MIQGYAGLPGIISVYFSLTSDEFVMIGMQYCSNGSLEKFVSNIKGNNEEKLKSISKQVLFILYSLISNGIVNRDIRPENILIDELGRLKFAVLGLEMDTNGKIKLTSNMSLAGIKRYMSPELESSETQSEKSNVWAFGALLLELAYGRDVFSDSEIKSMDRTKIRKELRKKGDFSREMAKFLSKCFERECSIRATTEELLRHRWLKDSAATTSSLIINKFIKMKKELL